jgi:hypothetical protein
VAPLSLYRQPFEHRADEVSGGVVARTVDADVSTTGSLMPWLRAAAFSVYLCVADPRISDREAESDLRVGLGALYRVASLAHFRGSLTTGEA